MKERLSPADKVFITYVTIIALLILFAGERIENRSLFLLGHAGAITFVTVLVKFIAPRLGAFGHLLRGWYAVAFIPATYKELEYLIPRLHPYDFDWQLAAIDYWFFGVHPTIWLERLHFPPLTEVLQILYVTYYFYPVILGIALWRKPSDEGFNFWVFILMYGFYLSYLGYIAVPAIGPRFILADQQTSPLTGILFFQTIRTALDLAEGITRDCFPSGHTEITLLVLYYAYRLHRPLFKWFIVPCSAIILSTVYLRYHYVVDVVAGILAASMVVLTAEFFYRLLECKKAEFFRQNDKPPK